MIRQPSTAAQLYAWHRATMAGQAPAIHDDLPECGWYRTRLIKNGPHVAVRIFIERDIDPDTGELTEPERIICEVAGKREDPWRYWTFLHPIPKREFDALMAAHAAGRDPRNKVNLMKEVAGPNG